MEDNFHHEGHKGISRRHTKEGKEGMSKVFAVGRRKSRLVGGGDAADKWLVISG